MIERDHFHFHFHFSFSISLSDLWIPNDRKKKKIQDEQTKSKP